MRSAGAAVQLDPGEAIPQANVRYAHLHSHIELAARLRQTGCLFQDRLMDILGKEREAGKDGGEKCWEGDSTHRPAE
jgi:hypothetical protein